MARLNLTQLATLREFSRRGTMAKAAEALGYTPGAVSQQIAELERSVGIALLVKVGRRAVLTDAGRVLASEADRVLLAEERARQALRPNRRCYRRSIGIGHMGQFSRSVARAVAHHCGRALSRTQSAHARD